MTRAGEERGTGIRVEGLQKMKMKRKTTSRGAFHGLMRVHYAVKVSEPFASEIL